MVVLLVGSALFEATAWAPRRLPTAGRRQVSRPRSRWVVPTLPFVPLPTTTTTTARRSSKEPEDEEDMPADWVADDILAELESVDLAATEFAVEQDVVAAAPVAAVLDEEDDDEDDEDAIDEIDFGEDDDDDEEEDDGTMVQVDLEDVGQVAAYEEEEEEEEAASPTSDVDWNEEEDGAYYELEDDEDPNYMKQKELAEIAAERSYERAQDEAFDPMEFMMNEMTDDQKAAMEQLSALKGVEDSVRGMELTAEDMGKIDLVEAVEEVPDIMADDPYPRHEEGEVNVIEATTGLTDDDMEEFDKAYKRANGKAAEEPWDKVVLKDLTGWEDLSNQTLAEMDACLGEIGGSSYNVTKWLLYDLDFNVSNLILASIKHNAEAPILFQHWYPQLVTYERYEHAQERNFDFNWDDVENSDMEELERYYAGFGYEEIPKKAPAETGIISLEDLDEEEIKMAAFESWMAEVYNPEWDRKDFDDDDMQDEDNVFSHFFEAAQHPDRPSFADSIEDIEQWKEDIGDDESLTEYRDMMGQGFEYEIQKDEEFEREFRGHLVIACTGAEADLDIAEKITLRFEKELGKQVFVETRILQLAREEDNVFEVWLESYEVDLLHSKKRATANAKGWFGPAECGDAQVEYLTERVKFLISDEARYSYRMESEVAE
jgi:hypothetical protein